MLDYASEINIKASGNHRSAAKGQKSISSKVEKVSESKSEVGPKKKLALSLRLYPHYKSLFVPYARTLSHKSHFFITLYMHGTPKLLILSTAWVEQEDSGGRAACLQQSCSAFQSNNVIGHR